MKQINAGKTLGNGQKLFAPPAWAVSHHLAKSAAKMGLIRKTAGQSNGHSRFAGLQHQLLGPANTLSQNVLGWGQLHTGFERTKELRLASLG